MEDYLISIAESIDCLLKRNPWITYFDQSGSNVETEESEKLVIVYEPEQQVLKIVHTIDPWGSPRRRVQVHFCDRSQAFRLAYEAITEWELGLAGSPDSALAPLVNH